MHRAGDEVTVLEGPEKGRTLQITSVRKYASDNGYHLRGGSGLYPPRRVRLARERTEGNPCATACEHDRVEDCQHCLGQCSCALRREMAADPLGNRVRLESPT